VLDYDGNNIKQYENAQALVKDFVTWRLGFYSVRYRKMIADATHQLNWNLALKACYDANLPNFLPKAKNKVEIIDKISAITQKIAITDEQRDRIASLPSYRWAKDAYDEVVAKIAELKNTIADYKNILGDPNKLKSIYRQEVAALKKLPTVDR
jgi:DNA gyrase/topoisomerase IV subunit A